MEDARGKKLLANLRIALTKDPNIDEFDFLPILEPQNNCNPIILENHKLGIELWAAKIIFSYAYSNLFSGDLSKLTRNDLLYMSQAVLMVNADNATVWNIRKDLINKTSLNPSDDLRFSALVLGKHPKSPEAFAHRKWVLRYLYKQTTSNDIETLCMNSYRLSPQINNTQTTNGNSSEDLSDFIIELVTKEFQVCTHAAALYPNNYNAWSHRIWVIQHICQFNRAILASELNFSRCWMEKNKSDFSGYHFRQFAITKLYNFNSSGLLSTEEWENFLKFLSEELIDIGMNIQDFPGHETLWSHRRFIVTTMYNLLGNRMGEEIRGAKKCKLDGNIDGGKCKTVTCTEDLLHNEVRFAEVARTQSRNEPIVLEWQQTLADSYIKWLKHLAP